MGGFRTYPSEFAGVADSARLLQDYTRKGFDTIEKIINRWAPPNENNTALLIQRAEQWSGMKRGDKLDLSNPEQLTKMLDVMNRNEFGGKQTVTPENLESYVKRYLGGERPGGAGAAGGGQPVREMTEAMAPAGTPAQGQGTVIVKSPSGRSFRVSAEYAKNFEGFLADYEKAGGVAGPASGGLSERPTNASYHPIGKAIDVNQIGRGIRARTGVTLPQALEDEIAARWGLYPGSRFGDAGHFEVRNRDAARKALDRLGIGRSGSAADANAKIGAYNRNFGEAAEPGGESQRDAFIRRTGMSPEAYRQGAGTTRNLTIDHDHKVTINVHGAQSETKTAQAVEEIQKRHALVAARNLRAAVA
jgi:hypothetical protein